MQHCYQQSLDIRVPQVSYHLRSVFWGDRVVEQFRLLAHTTVTAGLFRVVVHCCVSHAHGRGCQELKGSLFCEQDLDRAV
jgi:hypothetical protein